MGVGLAKAFSMPLLALALFVVSGPCIAESGATEVFRLVNERLAFMKEVAMVKAKSGKPVEDRAREELVITKAKERARQAGLDPSSIEEFFHTQISAAKAIQYRYLAEWALSRNPPEREPRDLVTEVRPELIRLGKEIVLAIRSFLGSGGRFTDTYFSEFLTAINVSNLNQGEKGKLFESMRQIALSRT
ncbi:MAG: gamma subclass chorismate mutase AroQ [Gammaproteobacteria bacterium]|nr:MAG: gamma subclass chorismate mutase AroQ [Gammaproteobacteria bacterium]